jgi:DNA modification methylase
MKNLPPNSVDLVLADPPYDRVVDAAWDQVKNMKEFSLKWLSEAVRILKPGAGIVIFGSPERSWISRIAVWLEDELKMQVVQTNCWVYNQGGGSRVSSMKKLAIQHELVLWAEKPGGDRTFNAADCVEYYAPEDRALALAKGKGRVSNESLDRGRPPRSFYDFQRENSRSKERSYGKHPSMKPLPLCEHLIKLHTNKGDSIFVPFGGSGSELISASKLGRMAVGAELEGEYISLMKRRFKGHEIAVSFVEKTKS